MSLSIKKKLTVVLSIILAGCMAMMIIPSLVKLGNALAETPVYFVKADGDDANDGRSDETPKKTIGGVINQIKLDDYDNKGQEVVVKVMRLANEPTTWSNQDDNSKFVYYYSSAIGHDATITYTSYDQTNYSTIAYFNEFGNNSRNLGVLGPTIFEKINLLDQRTDGATKSIFSHGFNLEFRDCEYLINSNPGQPFNSLNGRLNVYTGVCGYVEGSQKVMGEGVVRLEEYNYNNIVLGGMIDNEYSYSNNVKGETNLILYGGSVNAVNLSDYSSGAIQCCPVYNGNVNLVAYGNTIISSVLNGKCAGTTIVPIVKGAINIVLNDNATITGGSASNNFDIYAYSSSEKTEYAPVYVINNNSGSEQVVSPVSGEIGVFDTDGVRAYFYQTYGNQTTVYYGDGRITLPESGDYTVCYNESSLPIPQMESDKYGDYEFDKWVDNGDGTLSATFKLKTAKVGVYYVLSGGTGLEPQGVLVGKPYDANDSELGRSALKPLATVKDAILLINADGMTHADDVTVYVMQLDYEQGWWDTSNSLALSPLTSWSDDVRSYSSCVPKHDAVIKIKTYNFSGTNNYLGYTTKLGQNADLLLGGPVVFENITLVGMRYGDSRIAANGYDVTFGEGFDYVNVTADQYGTTTWDGSFSKNAGFRFEAGTGKTTMGGDGGVITVNGGLVSNGAISSGLNLSSHSGAYSFTDHVQYVLDNSLINVDLVFGTYAVNYNLLTINVKQALIVGFANRNRENQNITNLQVIAVEGQTFKSANLNGAGNWYDRTNGSINSIPSCVNYTNGWFITLSEGGLLEATDNAGKFKIADGKVAIATNGSTQLITLSQDGILDLSNAPANYSVRFVNESEMQDELVPVYFDGVLLGNKMKGETFVLPEKGNTILQEFSGWNDGTNFFANGETYTIAEDFYGISISFASVYKDFEGQTVIYVDEINGSNNYDGTSSSKAVASISKAIEILNTKNTQKKIVGIVGEYIFDENRLSAHTDMIYISGDGVVEGGEIKSRIIFSNSNSCFINGPTTFDNLRLHKTSGAIDSEDFKLVLGENISCEQSNQISIRAGKENSTFDVEINSGYIYSVYLSTKNPSNSTLLGGNFVMNGGKVLLFYFGNHGEATRITQNVNIVLNDSSMIQNMGYKIYDFDVEFAETSSLQFVVNSVNAAPTYRYGDLAKNVYVVTNFYSDTCKILPTETVGTFDIIGGKYAVLHYQPQGDTNYEKGTKIIAVNQDYTPATSISVESGNWSVKFYDNVDYINSLGEITVYKDNTFIDLSKELYKERGVFMGWEVRTKDGNTTFNLNTDGYYEAGTVITARFVECDYQDLFFIEGAQIKKGGTQAIRFIIQENKLVDQAVKQIASSYTFGVVYLETDLLAGNDLVKGGEYSLDFMSAYYQGIENDNGRIEGEKHTAKHQEITTLYKNTNSLYKYAFTLDNIADENLYTFYTVKGYIEYTDLNGNTKIIYTPYKAVNLYKLAKLASNDTETNYTESDKTEFERIKNYVKYTREELYFGQGGDGSIVGRTTPIEADENHTIYTTKNGLRVRKVTIEWDYDDQDTDSYEIVQISDTHFSGIDDVDRIEGSTTTVDTGEYYGYRYPQDAYNAVKVMEYGSMADKIIVTGDIYDYQSHYSMMKIKYLLTDKDTSIDGEGRSVLLVTGNHEHTQNTSGVIKEVYELNNRNEIRNDFYEENNNCIYYSEVVKNDNGFNRAMVILMDNQRDLYYDYLYEFLFDDLQIARQLNIPVLIFEHDPISSNNPAEKNLAHIGELNMGSGNATGHYNLYDGSGKIGGANANTSYPIDGPATQRIYELIVNSSDIIKGIFCGHTHNNYYSEIICPDGSIIPQYIINTTFDISNIASANTSINAGTLLHITIENI